MRWTSLFPLISTLGLTVGYSTTATATLVNFPDFSSTSGLTLVGDANNVNVPNQLQLTTAAIGQTGAAYSTTPITLGSGNSFSTQFQFQITNTGGIAPADGITFVLAASPTGLGGAGGGLGYVGVTHSVAIEFDTFFNGGIDSSNNHVAIDTGGNLNNLASANAYGISSCGFGAGNGCLSNGHIWTANVAYDGSLLNVSVSDPSEGSAFSAITNYTIDVGAELGTNTAYVGFTAGTGSGFESQNILNWKFSNTAVLPPTSVPEPLTLALVGLGLFGICATRRKS